MRNSLADYQGGETSFPEGHAAMTAKKVSRRQFFKETGALVITFSFVPGNLIQPTLAQTILPGSLVNEPELDAWIRVGADNRLTVFTGKVELGQGITTALAQIAGEELDVSFEKIQIISGDTGQTPDEGNTTGSRSIEVGGSALRTAAAEARRILLELAAKRFGIAAGELEVQDGVIRPKGKTTPEVSYGELIGGRRFQRQVTGEFSPKPPKDFQLVGRPIQRLDIPPKVTGLPSYVQDLRLPGMVHGRILHPPSYQSRLEQLEVDRARSVPGVIKVVRDGSFVGVIARKEEQAIQAVKILGESSKWNEQRDLPSPKDLFTYFRKLPAKQVVVRDEGSVQLALKGASKTLEATFTRPYQAHASMGPSCGVAQFRDDLLTVWTHSQGVYALRRELSGLLGLPQEKIRVIHREGAGCYGHNGADDAAAEAAFLARAAPGQPVRVQWMREDEFSWEPFGSAMLIDLKAGINKEGNIIAWDCELFSDNHGTRPGDGGALIAGWHLASPHLPRSEGNSRGAYRNAVPLYDFPNSRIVSQLVGGPLRVSALRALGGYANVFALESFMDELAFAVQTDPVEFRLGHLKDLRARDVLKIAAQRGEWKRRRHPKNNGSGVAFARYKNTAAYMALVVDVSVERSSGEVRVLRAQAAVDVGQTINPDGLKNQIEGGIIQATSWTLKEEVVFDQRGVSSRDWSTYPILTFPEVPEVEVSLIDRPTEAPLGAGEAAQGPTAAAIANAIFDAVGVRLRDIPLTPERVRAALG